MSAIHRSWIDSWEKTKKRILSGEVTEEQAAKLVYQRKFRNTSVSRSPTRRCRAQCWDRPSRHQTANILLTARGPKILDFGLAKALPSAAADTSMQPTLAPSPLLTDQGSTVGTVAYMSPEQLRGEKLDARSDLFSLGLVLYEMSTGRAAFPGATTAVISAAILHQQPPAPRHVRSDVSPRFEDVVLKAIEKDRSLRYQHASEMRTDIQRLKRDSDSARVPTADQYAARPHVTLRRNAIAAAGMLALVAGAYVYPG